MGKEASLVLRDRDRKESPQTEHSHGGSRPVCGRCGVMTPQVTRSSRVESPSPAPMTEDLSFSPVSPESTQVLSPSSPCEEIPGQG